MVEEDEAFIYTTWIKIYHQVEPINFCDNQTYLPNQRAMIKKLITNAQVLVACTPEDPNSIIGYIVFDFVGDILVLHWLHIKAIFRRFGLARDMIKQLYPRAKIDPIICTHMFRSFKSLRNKYSLYFDPYFNTRKNYEI